MKSHFPRLSRISLEDWLEFHPYDKEVSSDHYYIALCNDIQHEILFIDEEDSLVGGDYKFLSCILACYLEDIVSQTGIWKSFTNEHFRLYGKFLPFYDMCKYDPGNLNLADIQFLIWHFFSHLPIKSHLVDPYSIENADIAKFVFSVLNEAVCQAPINEDLMSALTLKKDANISDLADFFDFLFFKCFLQKNYSSTLLDGEIIDLKNKKAGSDNFKIMLENRRTQIAFNKVSPLLAQRSSMILANLAGKMHPLYSHLLALSTRKEGTFLYEGATPSHLLMKHIASEEQIALKNPNWKFPLTEGKTIINMGIVKWKNEWCAIGHVSQVDENNLKINDFEKFMFKEIDNQIGIIKRNQECFLELTDNNRIIILDNIRDAFDFIDKLWELFHRKYGRDTIDRKLFDVHSLTFGVDEDLENLVVFFNPRVGLEFYPDIAQSILMPDNKYYDIKSEINIEDLMFNERVSSDFVLFLIENQMIEMESITDKGGFVYVRSNCDFLLRYWKRERYMPEPVIIID